MKQKYLPIVLLLFSLFIVTIVAGAITPESSNFEGDNYLVSLGNPLAEDGQVDRALNVWDLQVFGNKIYVAGGSTVTNTGPINVWAYNPASKTFEKEYTVDEEAIEHYKVFDNQLYIPAADPRQGDVNKFYSKLADSSWKKYGSTEVKLAHVRDLIKTNEGEILVVGNHRRPKEPAYPSTAITKDGGESFQGAGVSNLDSAETILIDYNWFFSVFEYQQKIYATSSLLRDVYNYSGSISVYNPQNKQFAIDFAMFNDEFIPRSILNRKRKREEENFIYRLWNPVEFQNYLFYPVRSYSNHPSNYQQSYMNSVGFFYKQNMGKTAKKANLPRRARGEDLLIINNELYVLANKKKKADQFIVYVYKTDHIDNRIKWQEVLNFNSPNKARSFEYLDQKFYFGLGQDYGESINRAGEILSYQVDFL